MSTLSGVVWFVGMAIICVALLLVHERTRFRRMMIGGAVLVAGSIAVFLWLVWTTFPDRIR